MLAPVNGTEISDVERRDRMRLFRTAHIGPVTWLELMDHFGSATDAHSGAICDGGSTVAAMAGGIDTVYPPENEGLYHDIVAHGAAVSEMPPGLAPRSKHFPRRNRIVSGLSLAVVVIEAARK